MLGSGMFADTLDYMYMCSRIRVQSTLSKADTSLKRTVALVPRVSALERVDCSLVVELWPDRQSLFTLPS